MDSLSSESKTGTRIYMMYVRQKGRGNAVVNHVIDGALFMENMIQNGKRR